jgi:putative transposase
MPIFTKPADFDAFAALLREGCARVPGVRVLAYCLMRNHWHLVLWPRGDRDLAKFVGWVSTTHVRRWRQHRRSVGEGHLYQGRYKSFPAQADPHLLAVLRYVEANAVRARAAKHARDWPFCSLAARLAGGDAAAWLTDWPVDRPADWEAEVDAAQDERTLEALRVSVARGRPYGSEAWLRQTVKRLGLEHTVRDPWRPKKKPGKEAKHAAGRRRPPPAKARGERAGRARRKL